MINHVFVSENYQGSVQIQGYCFYLYLILKYEPIYNKIRCLIINYACSKWCQLKAKPPMLGPVFLWDQVCVRYVWFKHSPLVSWLHNKSEFYTFISVNALFTRRGGGLRERGTVIHFFFLATQRRNYEKKFFSF